MKRNEIVAKLRKYFDIKELVCPHIYEKFGEKAWDQIDVRLLETLLFIRSEIGLPMTVNTYPKGRLTQRGMRCNMCDMVRAKTKAYLSAHLFGQGVDFNLNGMNAESTRQWIIDNKERLPHPIRLEIGDNVTWVHLDIRNETDNKIVYFVQ